MVKEMFVEQYVMAYGVEQDRLRALLPADFISLRPVLRINAEIRDHAEGYVEFNTAVAKGERRGWLNIGYWQNAAFIRSGAKVIFSTDHLEISFTAVGIEGACPAERDNSGCYFLNGDAQGKIWRPAEIITARKEFCDCCFRWRFSAADAHGSSCGRTLSAEPEPIVHSYPAEELTAANAARIPCRQVLGSYRVRFIR